MVRGLLWLWKREEGVGLEDRELLVVQEDLTCGDLGFHIVVGEEGGTSKAISLEVGYDQGTKADSEAAAGKCDVDFA